ncbi:MAG: CoA transferase, partial [Rhodobacterales bacterium]
RRIDISMLDAQVTLLEHAIALTTVTGKAPGPIGSRHPSIAPFETFHASDGLFVIACGNDVLFEKLCVLLSLPLSDSPRFATNPERVKNARLLKRLIEAVTLDNTRAYWIAKMTAAGIPTGPIQSVDQVLRDPQILARNMVVDVLDKNGRAAFTAAGNPIKMSGADD